MPLIVNGKPVPHSVFSGKGHITTDKKYGPIVKAFPEIEYWRNKPEVEITENILYATQEEFVVIDAASRGVTQYIATDSATTCHIVIMVQPDKKVYGLGHFDGKNKGDGSNTNQGITDMLAAMDALSGTTGAASTYDLYVFGGFTDPDGTSHQISKEVFAALSQAPQHFVTKAILIDLLNTWDNNGVPFPIYYGAAVQLKQDGTMDILRVKVSGKGKGPIQPCKMARIFVDIGTMENGYVNNSKQMIMRPFDILYPVPDMDKWIIASDEDIREHFSSSPAQERDDFSFTTREAFIWLKKYPDPRTDFFGDKPLLFNQQADGTWTPAA